MLLPCEIYAEEFNICFKIFNNSKNGKSYISIAIRKGRVWLIICCSYLGTTLYSVVKYKHTPDVFRYLNVSLNNLFAYFSFIDSAEYI